MKQKRDSFVKFLLFEYQQRARPSRNSLFYLISTFSSMVTAGEKLRGWNSVVFTKVHKLSVSDAFGNDFNELRPPRFGSKFLRLAKCRKFSSSVRLTSVCPDTYFQGKNRFTFKIRYGKFQTIRGRFY